MHSRRLILNTMIVNEGQCRKGHVLIDDDRIERLVFGEAPRDLIDVAGVIDGEATVFGADDPRIAPEKMWELTGRIEGSHVFSSIGLYEDR